MATLVSNFKTEYKRKIPKIESVFLKKAMEVHSFKNFVAAGSVSPNILCILRERQ